MYTGLQIINEINQNLGYPKLETLENPTPSDEQVKVQTKVNRVLVTWGGYDDWSMLRKEGSIVLLAEERSSTSPTQYVTATQDSDTVTVQNITFDDTYIGRAFQVSGDPYVYRIIAIPATDQLQLNRGWVSDSVVVGDERTFIIAMDQYALPEDMDRPVNDWESFFAPYKILAINPDQFRAKRIADPGIRSGDSGFFTVYGMNNAETANIVHLHPFPKERRMLTFDYVQIHPEIDSDNDKILYPRRYIAALVDAVTQLCLRDFEDDSKEQSFIMQMLNAYNVQASNPGVTGSKLKLQNANRMRRSFHRAYGQGGYRINYGDYFDIVGFHNLP